MNDVRMVGQGQGSDRETRAACFEALYKAHMPELVRFASYRLPPDCVGDVVAEVFVVAWRRLAEVNPDNPRAWLYGVAQKIIANEVRARSRRTRLVRRADRLHGDEAPVVPEDAVRDNDDRLRVLAALDRLSPTDRDLLVAITWDGLSVAEAATVYGCTPATLSVRLHRARKRLAEEFRKGERGRTTPEVEARVVSLASLERPEGGHIR